MQGWGKQTQVPNEGNEQRHNLMWHGMQGSTALVYLAHTSHCMRARPAPAASLASQDCHTATRLHARSC
jgi:hypothetical protein